MSCGLRWVALLIRAVLTCSGMRVLNVGSNAHLHRVREQEYGRATWLGHGRMQVGWWLPLGESWPCLVIEAVNKLIIEQHVLGNMS